VPCCAQPTADSLQCARTTRLNGEAQPSAYNQTKRPPNRQMFTSSNVWRGNGHGRTAGTSMVHQYGAQRGSVATVHVVPRQRSPRACAYREPPAVCCKKCSGVRGHVQVIGSAFDSQAISPMAFTPRHTITFASPAIRLDYFARYWPVSVSPASAAAAIDDIFARGRCTLHLIFDSCWLMPVRYAADSCASASAAISAATPRYFASHCHAAIIFVFSH